MSKLWFKQSAIGDRGVSLVLDDLHSKGYTTEILDESIEENKGLYDILAKKDKTIKIEVKTDDFAMRNWNNPHWARIYIEYEQYGVPSCIQITEADIWCIVVGEKLHYILTEDLKLLCMTAELGASKKYNTKGYYIYRKELEDNLCEV